MWIVRFKVMLTKGFRGNLACFKVSVFVVTETLRWQKRPSVSLAVFNYVCIQSLSLLSMKLDLKEVNWKCIVRILWWL